MAFNQNNPGSYLFYSPLPPNAIPVAYLHEQHPPLHPIPPHPQACHRFVTDINPQAHTPMFYFIYHENVHEGMLAVSMSTLVSSYRLDTTGHATVSNNKYAKWAFRTDERTENCSDRWSLKTYEIDLTRSQPPVYCVRVSVSVSLFLRCVGEKEGGGG